MQQITQLRNDPDQIDLGIGQPGFDLLPLDFIQEAAQHFTNQVQREHLQYGAEAGDPNFLQELAYFLTDQYQLPIPSGQLMVTNGISQGLDLVCTLLTRPGDVIFVEEPTYFLALHLFADHGLQVVGIPMDEEGLLPDALAAALQQHQPVFLYTIPAFHNPTGRTLSAERRRLILEMSVTFDFLIVADEVYQMLDYGEMPPAPFAALVDSEQVISLGSFSKILAPGLRLGWLQTVPRRIETFTQSGVLQSGGGLNPFTAAVVHSWLRTGSQTAHLRHLRRIYGRRATILTTACREKLAEFATFDPVSGGFFLWLTLKEQIDGRRLFDLASQYQVMYQPGFNFSAAGGQQQGMRLCFAFYGPDELELGVDRLAEAIRAL